MITNDARSSEIELRGRNARKAFDALVVLGNEASFQQIRNQLDVAGDTATRWLDEAATRGLVEQVGERGRRGTFWRIKDSQTNLVVSSAREVILGILAEKGTVDDDRALLELMGRVRPGWKSLGTHSLDHQLFSMQKAGLIEMTVARQGAVKKLTRIHLPKKAIRTIAAADDSGRYVGEVSIPEVPAPEPDPVPEEKWGDVVLRPEAVIAVPQDVIDDAPDFREAMDDVLLNRFPILASLQARANERDETNRRAEAFLSAASALDGVAQDESDRLMALANEIADSIALTPIETEYLRFVSTVDAIARFGEESES